MKFAKKDTIMRFGKVFLALGLITGIAACTETTTIAVPAGLSTAQAFETVVFPRAIAVVVSNNCTTHGVTLREPDWQTGANRDVAGMVAKGYSSSEIIRVNTAARKRALTRKAISYLKGRGVVPRDIASLCKFGRDEIAKGTTIGRLLKKT